MDDEAATIELTEQLRAWMKRRRVHPKVATAALFYELTAVIAKEAKDLPMAMTVVDTMADVMKNQISRLGVGKDHP